MVIAMKLNKRKWLPLACLALLGSPGCIDSAQAGQGRLRALLAARGQAEKAPLPADVIERHLQSGGADRSYLLLDSSRGSQPAPLIIALHGGGGSAATMVPRWYAKARAEGLVIAFPDGVGRNGRMGTWNAGGCCGFAMTSDSDDVAFVASVIDAVQKTQRIDPRRIYVTGMSNGGMLTHKIAIALADRLAGAAVVAGALFGDERSPSVPVPVLIMHGVKDQVVGFEGGNSPLDFVARAQSKPFESVKYAVDFWVNADGCTSAPVTSASGEVTTTDYRQCRDGSEVLFYRLASATHTWPGASNAMKMLETTPYTAVNATDVIWDFFKKHARR